MSETSAASRTFSARANDLRCRDWSARLNRFLRARLHNLCAAGLQFADEPRTVTAWRKGWDAAHYARLLRWRDEGGMPRVIYDIGAHRGLWSEMTQHLFPAAHFLLFEPQREYQGFCEARRPAGARWDVVPVALGDRDEMHSMHVTENAAASSLLAPVAEQMPGIPGMASVRSEEVSVATLDGLVARKSLPVPDLVKIDVQGYERAVLAGGRETFSQTRRLVIEVSLQTIYRGQALLPEVASTLSGWGFELEDLNETCRPWPGPLSQVDLWWRRA